jgi:hypothetical protein
MSLKFLTPQTLFLNAFRRRLGAHAERKTIRGLTNLGGIVMRHIVIRFGG